MKLGYREQIIFESHHSVYPYINSFAIYNLLYAVEAFSLAVDVEVEAKVEATISFMKAASSASYSRTLVWLMW